MQMANLWRGGGSITLKLNILVSFLSGQTLSLNMNIHNDCFTYGLNHKCIDIEGYCYMLNTC